MNTLCNYISASLLLLCTFSQASASHFMGGSITYKMTGKTFLLGTSIVNTRTFRIQLKFYRNCSGYSATPGPTERVYFLPSINGQTKFLDLTEVGHKDVTPTCPGAVSACGGVPTLPYGSEEFVFEGDITVNVSVPHPPVTIQYASCCRNYAITNVVAPGDWYVSSYLDPNYDNSSPDFTFSPVFFISKCEPFTYNPGAVDPDGDSLVYQMTDCLKPLTYDPQNQNVLTTQSVGYYAPFSGKYPVTTACPPSFDSLTGTFSFFPTRYEISIFNYRITEYRKGIKIGEINRDIQIQIVGNANNSPRFVKPVCSNYQYACSGTIALSCDTTICVGGALNFTLDAEDIDSNTVTVTAAGLPPGASLTSVPTGVGYKSRSVISWSPTASNVGKIYTVTFQARDNGCALAGLSSYGYKIKVTTCGQSVPLNILSFTGKSSPGGNVLYWKSVEEEGLMKYIVERSADGQIYTPLGTVYPRNKISESSYVFEDQYVSTANVYYYRLKMVAMNYQVSYSAILILNTAPITNSFRLQSIAPNPSSTGFTVRVTNDQREYLKVEISDVYGKKVFEDRFDAVEGLNTYLVPAEQLGQGVYFLNVRKPDGTRDITKLVKN